MRIVIDLQACQTPGSKNRGIGRYSLSLAQAIARHAGHHEVLLLLNDQFPETIAEIRQHFDGLIARQGIRIFSIPTPVAQHDPANQWRIQIAEKLRDHFISQLKPDIVHVSSIVEGFTDNSVSAITPHPGLSNTATLYDLIPLLHAQRYLTDKQQTQWYLRKMQAFKNADFLLAISESSRQEAINHLKVAAEHVFNIGGAVESNFFPLQLSPDQQQAITQRYSLDKPFIMYTGGIDYRKNIEGLISAFARLQSPLRRDHQLAIVCSVQDAERQRLTHFCKQQGLGKNEVIFTGYVSDSDLNHLYNLAKLFVFPSLHEGFGLPVLEAMTCGTPTIGANSSSIPEVIGRRDALFDATRPEAIAQKITEVLTDNDFIETLRRHSLKQAQQFSWQKTAQKALAAFEQHHQQSPPSPLSADINSKPLKRLKMAFFSPLPPNRSGIADYSAELLPELARYYDIELIVIDNDINDQWLQANFPLRSIDWFKAHAGRYDRLLYQFGNSQFHAHMFELIKAYPGVMVLHDFFLSGVLGHMQTSNFAEHAFTRALYLSHGYPAVINYSRQGLEAAIYQYPANIEPLNTAVGVIVHSDFSRQLARRWYGEHFDRHWQKIAMLRNAQLSSAESARQRLGIDADAFIVCSFGFLGKTKLNQQLLEAWLASPLASDNSAHLIFVGENAPGDYAHTFNKTRQLSTIAGQIKVTGYCSAQVYSDWLAAADAAVQLRTLTRGETSAAILDCIVNGIPLICNNHGSAQEIPDTVAIKLPDAFEQQQLISALTELFNSKAQRRQLGTQSRRYAQAIHAPCKVGHDYYKTVEHFYAAHPNAEQQRLINELADIDGIDRQSPPEIAAIAQAIGNNRDQSTQQAQLLLDITAVAESDKPLSGWLSALLSCTVANYRVEPVVLRDDGYYYAADSVCRQLKIPRFMAETRVDAGQQDIWLAVDPNDDSGFAHIPLKIARRGRLALAEVGSTGQLLQAIGHWAENATGPSTLIKPLETQL